MKTLMIAAIAVLAMACQDLPSAPGLRPVIEPPDPTINTPRCESAATPPCPVEGADATYDHPGRQIHFIWTPGDTADTGISYHVYRLAGTDTTELGSATYTASEWFWPQATDSTTGFHADSIWDYRFAMRAQDTTVGVANTWSGYTDAFDVAHGTPEAVDLTADSIGTDFVDLSWPLSTNPTGTNDTYTYILFYVARSSTTGQFNEVHRCADCQSYRHSDVPAGEYFYKMRISYRIDGRLGSVDGEQLGVNVSGG